MDMGSFAYEVETEELYTGIEKDEETKFDTSGY